MFSVALKSYGRKKKELSIKHTSLEDVFLGHEFPRKLGETCMKSCLA